MTNGAGAARPRAHEFAAAQNHEILAHTDAR
jgi:hypothetical protein